MNQIRLHIWGDYACFTRPEMKVERVSYDVITPSAARGILAAVHWKPAIRWVIDRIYVLKPIRFESVRARDARIMLSPLGVKRRHINHALFHLRAEKMRRVAMVKINIVQHPA